MDDLDDLWREAEVGWVNDCHRTLALPPPTPPTQSARQE